MSRSDAIIERLHGLHPKLIDLSLGRMHGLLARIGHPEARLPPVIHVAGTNGKGSTCAFIRAIAEAAGLRVHVYTSPHLVSIHERFRVAGKLVDEAALADALADVERMNANEGATVFEVMTATALHLFAQNPADLAVIEVGLGGRYDATNVVPRPAASAITSISVDHADFLGDTLRQIAFEKAGVLKPDVPCAVGVQPREVRDVIAHEAQRCGARLRMRESAWDVAMNARGLTYRDADGTLELPRPGLPGPHQIDNAGIAITALRQSGLNIPDAAYAAIAQAEWPARMQRLRGALAALLPDGWELWLDGGHNPGAGVVLAEHLRDWNDKPTHMLVGMKKAKDTRLFLAPLIPHVTSLWAVAEPGQHLALPVEDIIAASGGVAKPGPRITDALRALAQQGGAPARVLICGSLYLAGEVLKDDQTTA